MDDVGVIVVYAGVDRLARHFLEFQESAGDKIVSSYLGKVHAPCLLYRAALDIPRQKTNRECLTRWMVADCKRLVNIQIVLRIFFTSSKLFSSRI
jgi:hypothetical protein